MKNKIILLCVIALTIVVVLVSLYSQGLLVTDYSARLGESNRIVWQGRTYWSTYAYGYEVGRIIAKGEPNLKLHQIKNDPEHNYLFSSGFRDSALYKAEDYKPSVNKSGDVKCVVWGEKTIKNADFLTAINEIEAQKISNYDYETSDISKEIPNKQKMQELYFKYEKSPFPDVFAGYLGKINGKWAITTYIPPNTVDYDFEENIIIYKKHIVKCYLLPQKYYDLLEKISNDEN